MEMTTTPPVAVPADPASYALGFWTTQTGQPHTLIEDICEITEHEFETYRTAVNTYAALTERTVYVLLQRNKHQLEATLAACTNVERMGGTFRQLDREALGVTLINELLNWLAAGKLYVENNASQIRRQYGDGSDALRRFWDAKSRASHFRGFRFAEALRDYAQHAAPPLSGMQVSKSESQPRSVEIYVLKSELLASDMQWSSGRKKLIEALPEQIAVMPLVVGAMEGYRLIEDEVLRLLLEACVAAIPTLREGIARVAHEPGQHPCALRFGDRDDGVEGVNISELTFPKPTDLDLLEAAAAGSDPLSRLKSQAPTAPSISSDMLAANRRAASLISIWIAHGEPSPELLEALDAALAADGARTLVSGLVNLSAYLSAMVGTLIGSTPQSLIGGFTMEAALPKGPPAPSF